MRVPTSNIYLDPENPRLPENSQGEPEGGLLRILKRDFDLNELAESMVRNGYFEEEPLVIIPKELPREFTGKPENELRADPDFVSFTEDPKTQFIVVEGNRRLATAKILLSDTLRKKLRVRDWPVLSKKITDNLGKLPVIVYPERKDVIAYLGVRHITGVQKWEPYAKARYIAGMVSQGYSLDEIQQKIGGGSSIRRSYTCYRLVEVMEEESEGSTDKAKDVFSYLLLAVGQGPIKEYIDLPRSWSDVDGRTPVPPEKIRNLKSLFCFLFGDGREKLAVIRESRDITGKLTDVLRDEETTQYLIDTWDLDGAYERSDGEERLILKQLVRANRDLESALGIIGRWKTEQVIAEAEKLKNTLDLIFRILED